MRNWPRNRKAKRLQIRCEAMQLFTWSPLMKSPRRSGEARGAEARSDSRSSSTGEVVVRCLSNLRISFQSDLSHCNNFKKESKGENRRQETGRISTKERCHIEMQHGISRICSALQTDRFAFLFSCRVLEG